MFLDTTLCDWNNPVAVLRAYCSFFFFFFFSIRWRQCNARESLFPSLRPSPPPFTPSTRHLLYWPTRERLDTTDRHRTTNSLWGNPFDAGKKPVITSTHHCATLAAQCARKATNFSGKWSGKTAEKKREDTKQHNKVAYIIDMHHSNFYQKWQIIQCDHHSLHMLLRRFFFSSSSSQVPLVLHRALWIFRPVARVVNTSDATSLFTALWELQRFAGVCIFFFCVCVCVLVCCSFVCLFGGGGDFNLKTSLAGLENRTHDSIIMSPWRPFPRKAS